MCAQQKLVYNRSSASIHCVYSMRHTLHCFHTDDAALASAALAANSHFDKELANVEDLTEAQYTEAIEHMRTELEKAQRPLTTTALFQSAVDKQLLGAHHKTLVRLANGMFHCGVARGAFILAGKEKQLSVGRATHAQRTQVTVQLFAHTSVWLKNGAFTLTDFETAHRTLALRFFCEFGPVDVASCQKFLGKVKLSDLNKCTFWKNVVDA